MIKKSLGFLLMPLCQKNVHRVCPDLENRGETHKIKVIKGIRRCVFFPERQEHHRSQKNLEGPVISRSHRKKEWETVCFCRSVAFGVNTEKCMELPVHHFTNAATAPPQNKACRSSGPAKLKKIKTKKLLCPKSRAEQFPSNRYPAAVDWKLVDMCGNILLHTSDGQISTES